MNNKKTIEIILDDLKIYDANKNQTLKQILEKKKKYNQDKFYQVELEFLKILDSNQPLNNQIADNIDTLILKEISISELICTFNTLLINNFIFKQEIERLNDILNYANKDVQNLIAQKRHFIKIFSTIDSNGNSKLIESQILSRSQMKINTSFTQQNQTTISQISPDGQVDSEQSSPCKLESLLKSQQFNCQKCGIAISQNGLLLQCLHGYHSLCFQDQINQQLNMGLTTLQCICGEKIHQWELRQVSEIVIQTILNNKLVENQLEKIQKDYCQRVLKCSFCEFFIIPKEYKVQEAYCPICFQNTEFQYVT